MAVVFLDQLSKFFALHFLSSQNSVPFLPPVLYLTLVQNRGVAFGLFSDFAPFLFALITVSLVFLFLIANQSHHKASLLDRWALSLILGGAIGNWIDRWRFSAVIDFLDFRVWPVFNLADSAITIGVGIYLLSLFRNHRNNTGES